MAEKWRDINGYDGIYQVSDLGQIRNTQTKNILHPTKLKNGRFTSLCPATDSKRTSR